jgi:hypothetical protein
VCFLSLMSSLVNSLSPLEKLDFLEANLGFLGLGFIPWKLEIRVLIENWKERVFLQHIDSLTCIHSSDEI